MPSKRCTGTKRDHHQCTRRTLWLNTSEDCDLEAKCWQHLEKENHLKVKQSNIPGAGKGLFVTQDMPAGTVVDQYSGERIDCQDAHDPNYNDPYIIEDDQGNVCITARDPLKSSVSRYANDPWGPDQNQRRHPNQRIRHPNVRPSGQIDGNCGNTGEDGELLAEDFVLTRNVHAGDELYFNYGNDYWNPNPPGQTSSDDNDSDYGPGRARGRRRGRREKRGGRGRPPKQEGIKVRGRVRVG